MIFFSAVAMPGTYFFLVSRKETGSDRVNTTISSPVAVRTSW
ncbi:MAG: hypothetical protein ACYC61_29150 [Isosphaeraceae bacterium]